MQAQRNLKIRSGDVELAVTEYGVGNAPTVLLVHGYPDSSEVWQQMVGPLSEEFHVVTYDVRGCGHSTAPRLKGDYSLQWLARDMAAVLDAVSPDEPVHLVAHDWGSIQSWEAVTDPQLQRRFRSFVTISGPSLDHVGHWIRSSLASGSAQRWKAVGGQFLHSWYIWMFQLPLIAPTLWKFVLGERWHDMLAEQQGIQAAPSATQLRDGVNGIELYRANIRRVALPQRRSTRVPVLQILPVRDDFVTPDLVRDCARPWVEQLSSVEIDAGHWAPLSHGPQLVQQIRDFVWGMTSDKGVPAALGG